MREAGPDEPSRTSSRRHDLDWLRVLAMLVVFTYHVGKLFDVDGWHLKNGELSEGISWWVRFANTWQMPLFFFLAGAASWFALGVRSSREYLLERVKRLMVPFVFGLFVLIPPQSYYEQVRQGAFSGSYLDFYPHWLRSLTPELSIRWFNVGHHLWFLGYLFVFLTLSLPLFVYLRSERGAGFRSALAVFLSLPGTIFLLAIPFSITEAIFQSLPSDPEGWSLFFFYLPFLLYGYLFLSDERLEAALRRHTWVALALGIPTMFGVVGLRLYGNLEPLQQAFGLQLAWRFLKGFNTWFWVIGLAGLGMRFLRKTNGLQQYLNRLVLPWYILHQTVIIVIGFYVIQWQTGIAVKFAVVFVSSLVSILVLFEILRRIGLLRFLFGMRPNPPIANLLTS